MERKTTTLNATTIIKRLPSSGYVCIYDKHYGTSPGVWKLEHKCKAEKCPWLRTKKEFEKVNVHFIGD
jgi:hypothetical protein